MFASTPPVQQLWCVCVYCRPVVITLDIIVQLFDFHCDTSLGRVFMLACLRIFVGVGLCALFVLSSTSIF